MADDRKPNVLIFFCDQLRLDLLGCYGGTLVRTPHIDALARDSAVFERAYTPTAICSPARASQNMFALLTRPGMSIKRKRKVLVEKISNYAMEGTEE